VKVVANFILNLFASHTILFVDN